MHLLEDVRQTLLQYCCCVHGEGASFSVVTKRTPPTHHARAVFPQLTCQLLDLKPSFVGKPQGHSSTRGVSPPNPLRERRVERMGAGSLPIGARVLGTGTSTRVRAFTARAAQYPRCP